MARVSPRAIVVTLAILWLFFYPSSRTGYTPTEDERDLAGAALDRSEQHILVLNSTAYGDFAPWVSPGPDVPDVKEGRWLNLTGFRDDDGFAWSRIPRVHEGARAQMERALQQPISLVLDGGAGNITGLYRNMTGSVKGRWTRRPWTEGLPLPHINLTQLAPHTRFASGSWERNITTDNGLIQMRIDQTDEEETEGAIGITASIAVQSGAAFGGGWEASAWGVHFPAYGHAVLSTSSEKFAGLYALPHLTLSAAQFHLAQENLNISLAKMIRHRREDLASTRLVDTDVSLPKCELLIYLQQYPASPPEPLEGIEQELRFPSGHWPALIPPLTTSLTAFSPDCGYLIESEGPPDFPPGPFAHLRGHKTEDTQAIVRNVLLGSSLLLAAQIFLLTRQMRLCSTPSRQSKISVRALSILSLGDYMILMIAAFLIPVADGLLVPLVLALFVSLIGGSVLPSRIMLDVFNAQEPERIEAEREARRLNPLPPTPPTPSSPSNPTTPTDELENGPLLPPPVLATLPATPFATPLPTITARRDPAERRQTFPRLYTLNVLGLLALFFLTALALATLPPAPLYLYTRALALLYASPWLPQIWRQAVRSYSRAFSLWYIGLVSVCKVLPLLWLWGSRTSLAGRIFLACRAGVGEDLLPMTADEPFVALCALWLWAQFVVLAGADALGGRWWVPRALRARAGMKDGWDWTRLAALAVDERADRECAICMSAVPLPEAAAPSSVEATPAGDEGGWAALLARLEGLGKSVASAGRTPYMITPCRHVFHRECLEGWMGLRLQCPICREGLPAL